MRVKKIIRGEKILNQRVNLNENSFNKRKTQKNKGQIKKNKTTYDLIE